MKTEIPVYIFASPDSDNEKGYYLKLFSENERWRAYGDDIKLNDKPISFTAELPDISEQEMLQRAIATLKENQQRVIAEAEQERLKIEDKINKLLMLTHKPDLSVVS